MGIFDKFRKKKTESAPPPEAASKNAPKSEEVSPGGSTIYRYKEQEDHGFRPPEAYAVHMEEIQEHFEKIFPGRKSTVYHETLSDLVHVDLHVLWPQKDSDFFVLYTTGMSDMPMYLPEELDDREDLKYSELYMFLPGDWYLGNPNKTDEKLTYDSVWPIQILRFLARFPHEYKTWLGWGHSIPNGPDYAPISDTVPFGGAVLSALDPVPPLKAKDGKPINFFFVIPAYKEEIEYKLKYGMEGLDERFGENKLPVILDIRRPNYCADFKEVLD